MKNIKLISLFTSLLLYSTVLFAQKQTTEQLIVPLSDPGKPYSLNVNLITGSIKVMSHTGKDVIIDVTTKTSEEDDQQVSASGMKKISNRSGYEIVANESNNVISIHNRRHDRAISLSLKIPSDVKLKLHTINNGTIEADNVKGELEVNNVNGSIKLTNISGSVVASSVNGEVLTTFVSVDPKAAMAFSTLNGNVDITFPANTKSNLKLKSDRGEIYTDFEINVDKSQPKVNRTNESGMHKLSVDEWVYGTTNGGGPEFMMKTMNGNIYIRKAK